jgi:hypothetical protein
MCHLSSLFAYGMVIMAGLLFAPMDGFGAETSSPVVTDSFEKAIESMADDLVKFLKPSGLRLRVDSFLAPNTTSNGAAVVKSLRDELRKRGVTEEGATHSVAGKIKMGRRDEQVVVVLEAEIVDAANDTEQELKQRIVMDQTKALQLFGITVDASIATGGPPKSSSANPPIANAKPPAETPLPPQKAADSIAASVTTPRVAVVPQLSADSPEAGVVRQLIRAAPDSPYALEIERQSAPGKFEPCFIRVEQVGTSGRQAFVELKPTDVFEIRLHNDGQSRVGCILTLDGVNTFAFSDVPAWRQLGKMVLSPGKSVVRGWHRNDALSHEFVITKIGSGAASQLGVINNVGAITAVFVQVSDQPFKDGPLVDAVGVGKLKEAPYKTVPAYFGEPIAAITVRYRRPQPPANLPLGAPPPNAVPDSANSRP